VCEIHLADNPSNMISTRSVGSFCCAYKLYQRLLGDV